MNTRTGASIFFLVLMTLAASAQAKSEKPLTAQGQSLIAAEKGFLEAAKKGDTAYFKRILTDDFSYVGFDGQLADRQQMLDERGDPGFNVLPYNMKVLSLGDGVGIVTYDVVLRVPPSEDEGPPPRYQHFSTVWVREGDVWKMKFLQMTASHWGDW